MAMVRSLYVTLHYEVCLLAQVTLLSCNRYLIVRQDFFYGGFYGIIGLDLSNYWHKRRPCFNWGV